MAESIGPWTVSGPAREVARLALLDDNWQTAMRKKLTLAGAWLHDILQPLGEVKSAHLFATLNSPHTAELHLYLAQQGILTRIFDQQPLLRFGLPGNEPDWQRLSSALIQWKPA